jgi:hypothetical protein
MRLRTVILILAGLLFLDLFVILGVWIWKRSKPLPFAAQPAVAVVGETSSTEESESPMPQPAPTARFDSTPVIASDVAPSVTIESPQESQSVPRRFTASGRCGTLPAGYRLMLVVDSGRGVYSPKMPPLEVSNGRWSGTCNEFGAPAGGSFSLCVFQVSEHGVEQITQWHEESKITGKYPPFRQGVPGGVSLARIKLRVASGGTK